MIHELSTGGTGCASPSKKGEGKKRTSPFTPYREKGKVKEQYRVSCETSILKPARAHARKRLRCTCSYEEAGAAADEIVGSCFGTTRDQALWAWYCRHFDRRRIVEKAHEYASMQRQGEVRDAVTAFQAWLRKEYGKSSFAEGCHRSASRYGVQGGGQGRAR